MRCDACGGSSDGEGGHRCSRCRLQMRHAARRLRDVLDALCDGRVMRLLDELADRPQAAASPVFRTLRGSAALCAAGGEFLLDADGWLLDVEARA